MGPDVINANIAKDDWTALRRCLQAIKHHLGTASGSISADKLDGQHGTYYRDSANFTGTNWTDLTDGGASALHTHATPVHTHANGLMTVDIVAVDFTVPLGNTALYNNMQVPPARTVSVVGLLVNPGWS